MLQHNATGHIKYKNVLYSVILYELSPQGQVVFEELIATAERGVKIRIVQNVPTREFPNNDSELLSKMGLADVRSLNFSELHIPGILHTKLWIVDNKHFYVGSANMDWRSLTQVIL